MRIKTLKLKRVYRWHMWVERKNRCHGSAKGFGQVQYLKDDWSPEQISGLLRETEDIRIRHESINQFERHCFQHHIRYRK